MKFFDPVAGGRVDPDEEIDQVSERVDSMALRAVNGAAADRRLQPQLSLKTTGHR